MIRVSQGEGPNRHGVKSKQGAELAAARALVAAVDRDRIAVSFRPEGDAPVWRTIATLAEHSERLRAIAWLAGNVARDQVGPLLNQASMGGDTTLPVVPATAEPVAVPASPPATEPPPLAAQPAATVATAVPAAATGTLWSIRIGIGPTFRPWVTISNVSDGLPWNSSPFAALAWQISVIRRPASGGTVLGLDLEGTSFMNTPQLLGVGALVGTERRFAHWTLEAEIGSGLEAAQVWVDTSSGAGRQSITSTTTVPALFLRGALIAAVPVSQSTELVAQLGCHASTAALGNLDALGTVGLRYTLP